MKFVPDMKLAEDCLDVTAVEMVPTRNGFGDGLVALGKEHEEVVAFGADLTDSTRVGVFRDAFPDRFIEVGIAEQNMAVIAAGMSKEGKVPFISTYGVFCPGRNWDQVRISIAYNKTNVKIAGAHAGISVGPDGATHQALEDIALMRVLPNMTVMAPCDAVQTQKATEAAYAIDGPVYLRFAREKTAVFTTDDTPFEVGKAQVLVKGHDATIVACGPFVYEALQAAESLRGDVACEVINLHTIKPIDRKALVASAKKTGCVVTVEEHQVMGGMGSAVAEVLAKERPVPMRFVGMQDSFGESGQPEELLKKYGMTTESIVEAVRDVTSAK